MAKVLEFQLHPGDTLYTVAQTVRLTSRLGVFSLKGYVEDELAAEATATCMIGTIDSMKK